MTSKLACIAALAAVLVPASAAGPAAAVGEQSVLVVLATWEGEREWWPRADVVAALHEADAFLRKSSFQQLRLNGTVTEWLRGYPGIPDCPAAEHERIPLALTDGPDAAARAAGFRPESYDRVVYIIPRIGCQWLGVGVGRQVMLNGTMNAWGIVHELGHTYGLAHARGRECQTCRSNEYGDPFSPMGQGLVDFSVFEKVHLGWLSDVARAPGPGRYAIGRPDVPAAKPHAVVFSSGAGEYWFEQRLDVERPGLVVRKIEPDVPDDDLTPPTMFIGPTVPTNGTFRVPGAFAVTYRAASLEFTWIDRTRPRAARVVAPRNVPLGRAVRVTWAASDAGSGIASCALSVDRKVAARGDAKGAFTLTRLQRGTHTVSVVCVDRAGNASRPAVRRVRVGSP